MAIAPFSYLPTRRGFVAGTLGLALVARARAAGSAPASDRLALQRLAAEGGGVIARRDTPYVLNGPIDLPGGCNLQIEPGTAFACAFAPRASGVSIDGVFIVGGDNVTVGVAGSGTALVTMASPDASRYAVVSRGWSNLTVRGLQAVDCGHVFCGAGTDSYRRIVRTGGGANVVRNIRIAGGGARFVRLPEVDGHAACTLQYVVDFAVTDCTYENVRHGVQWWGGDANPKVDGALENDRKCGDGRIERVKVRNALGASVWGSMGHDITVADCSGQNAGDVGFDAEGCVDVTFVRCTQRDARNGCFSTFFFNRGIIFDDCSGYQGIGGRSLFRLYNEAQSFDNRDVTVRGGRFECGAATPGSFDDASGSVRKLIVTGASFVNVTLQLHQHNKHDVTITGNTLTFPKAVRQRFAAIKVGRSHRDGATEGRTLVADNIITSKVAQPAGSVGIEIYQDDYNGSPVSVVQRNRISGFPAGIAGEWASANAGMQARFDIRDNIAPGKTIVRTRNRGRPAQVARSRNRDAKGRATD